MVTGKIQMTLGVQPVPQNENNGAVHFFFFLCFECVIDGHFKSGSGYERDLWVSMVWYVKINIRYQGLYKISFEKME